MLWTVPLAFGLAITGRPIVTFLRPSRFVTRVFLIMVLCGIISLACISTLSNTVGLWIGYIFPSFFIWFAGNVSQLLFLDWRLLKSETTRQ